MTPTTPTTRRSAARLDPDPSRVLGQLFVPGQALAGERDVRASNTVAHVLGLSDTEVAAALEEIMERFDGRHRDLASMLDRHAGRLANRLPADVELSARRRALLGATFTQEVALQGAAVCNPSAVPAPDQTGLAAGELRAVLSVRQIGEGHRSTIGFRSVVIDADGDVTVEPGGPYSTAGAIEETELDAATFADQTAGRDGDAIRWVLARLGPRFTRAALRRQLEDLQSQQDTRRDVSGTSARLLALASRCYGVGFDAASSLDERVLVPGCAAESHGLEDARFVRVEDGGGAGVYHATYTAFDGVAIAQQLLTTTDFRSFTSLPLRGDGAANKGLALFPRRIGGRFHALSRCDGERNAVAVSDDLCHWPSATPLEIDGRTWSSVQVGNCGSPIELPEGWLVLTHGVGAMRTYSIGALLLDLDDPSVVIGRTAQPLIAPGPTERDGYVPNVVYSCGALRHRDHLVVPLGIADRRVGFASLPLAIVRAALLDDGTRSP